MYNLLSKFFGVDLGMKKILVLLALLLIQLPAFSSNNLDLEAGNPAQLLYHTSQYARVKGTVVNTDITDRSKVIFLNFGKSYNTCLSAVIYDENIPSFISAGINEPSEFYKNKTVSMEGIIRISNGKPEIIIDSPSQIKVIGNGAESP